ncbi:hypothetical protein DOTSEDRAFT_71183 [Dothistroma septosporum NZE10]|uniref:Uncharacterized protein n=1 Tax=Dothistroma septosporum (strain NZE10 / CBS 128990) TaxID=675120 RepID=N1PPQ7_DOTSN|nr:hypothetical protein DOTSEDRAFT_71183 [Dothistroma septosporum NZE10]
MQMRRHVLPLLLALAAANPLSPDKHGAKPAGFGVTVSASVLLAQEQSSATAYCSSFLGLKPSTVTVFTSTSTSVTPGGTTCPLPLALTTASTTYPDCSPPSAYTQLAAREKRAYGAEVNVKPKTS